jgi:hypothetical protein
MWVHVEAIQGSICLSGALAASSWRYKGGLLQRDSRAG